MLTSHVTWHARGSTRRVRKCQLPGAAVAAVSWLYNSSTTLHKNAPGRRITNTCSQGHNNAQSHDVLIRTRIHAVVPSSSSQGHTRPHRSACAVRGIRRIVLDRSGLGRLPSDEVRGAPPALATKLVEAEAAGERVREGKVLGVCLDGQKQSKCRRA